MKVWVVIGTEDDDTMSGCRYVSSVFDSEEKANAYAAETGWAMSVEEFDVR